MRLVYLAGESDFSMDVVVLLSRHPLPLHLPGSCKVHSHGFSLALQWCHRHLLAAINRADWRLSQDPSCPFSPNLTRSSKQISCQQLAQSHVDDSEKTLGRLQNVIACISVTGPTVKVEGNSAPARNKTAKTPKSQDDSPMGPKHTTTRHWLK